MPLNKKKTYQTKADMAVNKDIKPNNYMDSSIQMPGQKMRDSVHPSALEVKSYLRSW